MKNILIYSLVMTSILSATSSMAASRYFYDVQKFQAILNSKEVESKLGASTLDGIELQSIDQAGRKINYQLKADNGKCTVAVILGWRSDGFEPNYSVISVSDIVCN